MLREITGDTTKLEPVNDHIRWLVPVTINHKMQNV